MLKELNNSWAWRGVDATEIIAQNRFGNLIFRDKRGDYWRLSPEELECKVIANSAADYSKLWLDNAFLTDWNMAPLVEVAESRFGIQPEGLCFCLKIPGVLGGAYASENIGTISVSELVRFSGDIAEQIKDLPDGTHVEFRFTE